MTMTDAEIVQIAHLVLAVDAGEASEDELAPPLDTVKGAADSLAMWVAVKLIEGKQYAVSTDNPETVRRARSIAQAVGGTVESAEEAEGMTRLLFSPQVRQ
jgi:hypothetical protein